MYLALALVQTPINSCGVSSTDGRSVGNTAPGWQFGQPMKACCINTLPVDQCYLGCELCLPPPTSSCTGGSLRRSCSRVGQLAGLRLSASCRRPLGALCEF